jgi:protein phosphatase 1 regulatory subunit 10
VPPKPTPEERKQQFQNDIKPRLQSFAFTGAQAVASLVDHITDYGAADVDPAMRLEILTKIRDGAGNHYFRAWLENLMAMDITRDWLKSALTAKDDGSQLEDTIMPLLHVSGRIVKLPE